MIGRFLAIVAVADLRRLRLAIDAAHGLARGLAKPTFGVWLSMLREALRANPGQPFVRELRDFHRSNTGRLGDLNAIRNRIVHDEVPQNEWIEPRQLPNALSQAVELLEAVLEDLAFLCKYELAVVRPAYVEKTRRAQPRYIREKIVLSGCADVFDRVSEPSTAVCETSEILLFAEDGAYLNLDPLVLYSKEGIEERVTNGETKQVATEITDIFVYNGHKGNGRQFFACGRGGTLTRTTQEPDFAELEQHLGASQ
jgi:hypothetical protein